MAGQYQATLREATLQVLLKNLADREHERHRDRDLGVAHALVRHMPQGQVKITRQQ